MSFSCKRRLAAIALALAVTQTPLFAQATRPTAKSGPLGELPMSRTIFQEQASSMEEEITARALARADASGLAKARLELELDLRLLGAWLASAKGDDEVLANAYLRSRQLAEAAELLQAQLTDEKLASLTAAQKEGIKRLHDLTYRLPEAASVAVLDSTCRTIAWGLFQAGTPQVVGENSLPQMRPATVPAAPDFAPPLATKPAARIEQKDPEKLLPRLNVSPALRRQLLQMQDAMRTAESSRAADAAPLRKMLYEAIDLAVGFSANAAVESEERLALEQQLTEALALYVDPRTRSIARSRLDALGQYRGLVQTISDLSLSPQSYRLLSPAFQYVQQHPAESVKILDSVKQFVDMATKYESLPKEMPAPAAMTRLPAIYQEARKTFENCRNLYLGAVEGLSSTTLMSGGPDALPPALADMRLSYDVVTALPQLPEAVEALNGFKPKPIGGLEKRIVQEAAVAAGGQGTPRSEAAKLMGNVLLLGETARRLPKLDFDALPAEALAKQGIDNVKELAGKARAAVAGMAADLAASGTLDAARLAQQQDLPKLLSSLKSASGTQEVFAQVDLLGRWADWDGNRETLALVMSPYLTALNSAVAGYLADTGEAIRELPQVEYATYPLRTLLVRDLQAGTQLAKLPDGLASACGKLSTPAGEFGAERFTSFGIVVWARARAGGDLKSSETALKLISKRIAADLNLRFDERRASFSLPAPTGAGSETSHPATTSQPAGRTRRGAGGLPR